MTIIHVFPPSDKAENIHSSRMLLCYKSCQGICSRLGSVSNAATKSDKLPLVELKNGKVIFRQKPLSCEKMSETMQGTCLDYLSNFDGKALHERLTLDILL